MEDMFRDLAKFLYFAVYAIPVLLVVTTVLAILLVVKW